MMTTTDAIPEELRDRPQWLVFRAEPNDGGKLVKRPYQSRATRTLASTVNAAMWSTYEEARTAVARDRSLHGVGFAFSASDPYTGIDLDHVIDEDGVISKFALKVIALLDSYTEYSYSGDGIHIIVRAKTSKGYHGRLEAYSSGRYFVTTGNHVPGTPTTINEAQDGVDELIAAFFTDPEPAAPPLPAQPNTIADRELLNRAYASKNGAAVRSLYEGDTSAHQGDDSAADLALCNHLAFYTGRDAPRMDALFRASGLMRPKWDERHGAATYGQMTITKAIEATRETYSASAGGVMSTNSTFGRNSLNNSNSSEADPETGEMPYRINPIDWGEFWVTDHKAEDWLLEPIIPRGRSIALYAPAKAGKSLLVLNLMAHLATGQHILSQASGEPIDVCYFDLEMTESDLFERLSDMGYDADTDFSHFHYYMLPNLPPLDTPEGGAAVMQIVQRHNAQVVVIDTTSRVIDGPENDADTLRALYICTMLPMKAAGVTVLRLDHAGKDIEKGQRGSSAKNDDVDLVWRLTAHDLGVTLTATHRRQSWIPETVELEIREDPLVYIQTAATWPTGTSEAAALLDKLGVPLDFSKPKAREILRANDKKMANVLLGKAISYRRGLAQTGPDHMRTDIISMTADRSADRSVLDSRTASGPLGPVEGGDADRLRYIVADRYAVEGPDPAKVVYKQSTCSHCFLGSSASAMSDGICVSCIKVLKEKKE